MVMYNIIPLELFHEFSADASVRKKRNIQLINALQPIELRSEKLKTKRRKTGIS